jgi:ion channel-forming bestrophin family protein
MPAFLHAMRRLFPPLKIRAKLLSSMSVLVLYGLLVGVAVSVERLPHIDWGAESTVLNGLVLGFLIAFRNNHAYDRWWEARKLWGQLINDSRNLCLKVRALNGIDSTERDAIGRYVIAFGNALKNHLRSPDGSDESPVENELAKDHVHQPLQVAGAIYETLTRWQSAARLDGWSLLWLAPEAKSLMDICGACERIRNTPLSSSYRALLRHGIALYLAIAPFYLIEDTGLAGFPVFILAAYFLLGIELVAEEIEEPFGQGGDNLPLERYCATIEASVCEILGTPAANGTSAVPIPVGPAF